MRPAGAVAWPLLALLFPLGGCAAVACAPTEIVVADREERTRVEREFRGVRTDERGRVTERRRDRAVAEYWVRDARGAWHPVDAATYAAAEPGRVVSVCR